MNKKNIIIILSLVVLLAGSFFLYNFLKDKEQPPQNPSIAEYTQQKSENKAMDFTVQDREGNDVKLSSFFGKPIVLNFWASWCPPCKSEMPYFEAVYKEMGNDVQFIMLNSTDGARETKFDGEKYINEKGFTFPVFFDIEQDAALKYGIMALPTTVFIDEQGNIVKIYEGAINEQKLRDGINQIKK